MYKKLIAVGLSCSLFAVPTLASAMGTSSSVNENPDMIDSFTIEMEGNDYAFTRYEKNGTRVIEVHDSSGREAHKVTLNTNTNELEIDGELVSVEDSNQLSSLSTQHTNLSGVKSPKENIGTNAVVYPGGGGSSWTPYATFTVSFQAFSYAPTILAALLIYANLDSKSVKNKAATLVVLAGVMAGQASKVTFKTRVYSKVKDLYPYTDILVHKYYINTYNSSGKFIRGVEFEAF
ncbi:hypothetical protein Q9251_21395 [Alkalihalobacillus macyae]|uniref:hypothetical protein n=1 Tax=Guptibacillus hwajinpoensis TaxID=208199 RepID=UPI00273C5E55|nr:hypothetical protein [Alkalihalobacillus macyae]MDP4553414.1 hypothetical protein [Alkalihalobacillus macyae]